VLVLVGQLQLGMHPHWSQLPRSNDSEQSLLRSACFVLALTKVYGCVWYNAQHAGSVSPAAVTAAAPAAPAAAAASKLLEISVGPLGQLQHDQLKCKSNMAAVLQPAAANYFRADLH
jgi:hypothetical protein